MTEKEETSHVFGPVPSRRLGRSLGVDLLPFKTCTYDCIYCQLGRTTCKTVDRSEWVPLEAVREQIRAKLPSAPDYITLSGSGEPTLCSRLEELIASIKEMTDIPVAVLTNGSLLWVPEVRQSLLQADLVVPSLDAPDSSLFKAINRPHRNISFEKMVKGLIEFRELYDGGFWLEVFILSGVNASLTEVEKLAAIVREIDPDRVQLNTVTRPPAEDFAFPVPREEMERIAASFGDRAGVITDVWNVHKQVEFTARRREVLDLLCRRPCTIEDLEHGLGFHRNEIVKFIEELTVEGKVGAENHNRNVFFKAI